MLEALAMRMMMSVSTDASGWINVAPSSDSRIVYVSSSQGNDNNSGLSANAPVQSLAKAESLMRNGMPDEMLLLRGDTWNTGLGTWMDSGRSNTEPMVIGSYGSSASRPIVNSGNDTALGTGNAGSGRPVNFLVINGISFQGNTTTGSPCIYWLAGTQGLVLEDTSITGYANGIVLETYFSQPITNVAILRSQIYDNYGCGLFADGVQGLNLQGNIFDHNGWSATKPADVRTHDAYITGKCSGFVANGNIFANASANGLQARAGGIVTNNLFLDDPIGLTYGLLDGGGTLTPGGVSGTVSGNVFLGSRDISGSPRGWAMDIANIKPNSGTTIQNNIIADDNQLQIAAIQLSVGKGNANPQDSPGIQDLTIQNNVVYNWEAGLWINGSLVPGGTGQTGLNGLVVKNNDFQDMVATKAGGIQNDAGYVASAEQFSGNRYSSSGSNASIVNSGFSNLGTTESLAQWQASAEPTAQAVTVNYPDPTRTAGSYNATLGGAATDAAFMANADQESRASWNVNFTAQAVINYVQEGFGKLAPAQVNLTPTLNAQTSSSLSVGSYNVSLSRPPLATVAIALTSSNAADVLSTRTLTFTPANWNVPQTVTVLGSGVSLAHQASLSTTISGIATSSDVAYSGLKVSAMISAPVNTSPTVPPIGAVGTYTPVGQSTLPPAPTSTSTLPTAPSPTLSAPSTVPSLATTPQPLPFNLITKILLGF